jgi:hypothetical protein
VSGCPQTPVSNLGLVKPDYRRYVRNTASHPVLPAEHRMPKFRRRRQSPMSTNTHTENTRADAPVSRLRLTRRGRVVFTALAAAPLVFAALGFAVNGGMATATVDSGSPAASSSITVLSGQSLWQLAEEISPEEDTREVVAQLLQANALDSAEVYPGQRLVVPAQYR